jgi:hypothetical protein
MNKSKEIKENIVFFKKELLIVAVLIIAASAISFTLVFSARASRILVYKLSVGAVLSIVLSAALISGAVIVAFGWQLLKIKYEEWKINKNSSYLRGK